VGVSVARAVQLPLTLVSRSHHEEHEAIMSSIDHTRSE
jgi:hypothetical protein